MPRLQSDVDNCHKTPTNLLLSRRSSMSVGWASIDEFEDLFAQLGDVPISSPVIRPTHSHFLGAMRDRMLGSYHPLRNTKSGIELLIVIGRAPSDLRMIYSVSNFRKRARHIAGYVIDSYFVDGFDSSAREYDHIFCTTEEGAETVRKRFGISSSVLRQGFDCLKWSSINPARSIDLIGFGRQPPSYHLAFQRTFHTSVSPLLYLHSPIGSLHGPAVGIERPMLLKLLQQSKLSLAFHLLVEAIDRRPRVATFVTSRWLESLATGCVVVGKRPPGRMADELFDWPNATIELADDPMEAIEQVRSMALADTFLEKTRARNVSHMCKKHDWRYRIRDIYRHFQMKLPQGLQNELCELEQLVRRLEPKTSALLFE